MIHRTFIQFLLPGCTKLKPHYPPKDLKHEETTVRVRATLPKISIVIPSYNQGEYLEQTISSVLQQNYPNLELIVVDGGSQDRSREIIDKYSDKLTWWVSEKDGGQAHAINKGMKRSTGEILGWLNSDDCLCPGTLFEVANTFNSKPHVDVVYGHRIIINEAGKDVGKWIIPQHDHLALRFADFVPQESLYWRRQIWERIGEQVDENFEFALDWDLIIKLMDVGGNFYRIPKFLGLFRVHLRQKTSSIITDVGFREMDIVRNTALQNYKISDYHPTILRLIQKLAITRFLLQAKMLEALWKLKLIKID